MKLTYKQSGFVPVLLLLMGSMVVLGVSGYNYFAHKNELKSVANLNHSGSESVVSKSVQEASNDATYTSQVAGLSASITPEVKVVEKSVPFSQEVVRLAVADEMKTLLAQGLLQGPKGDRGEKGESGQVLDVSSEISVVNPTNSLNPNSLIPQYAPIFYNPGSNTNSQRPLSMMSATSVTCDTCQVNQNLTVGQNLSVSGTISGSLNPGLVSGSLLFQSSSGITQDNANLFWNDSNNRLGLGTNSPASMLHVSVAPTISLVGSIAGMTGLATQAMAVSGKYLYTISLHGKILYIADVSNPNSPVLVSSTSLPGGFFSYTLDVKGKYAYIGNTIGNVMIWDVSNPFSPVQVGAVGGGGVVRLEVVGSYAYLLGCCGMPFSIIDVSNPRAPEYISSAPSSSSDAYDVVVSGKYAYFGDISDNVLRIYDISNPRIPVEVSNIATNNTPKSIAKVGNIVYVGTEVAPTALQVFNVKDPANPTLVTTISTASAVEQLQILERYLYAGGFTGIDIYDISTPTLPTLVKTIPGLSVPIAINGRYIFGTSTTVANRVDIYNLDGGYIQQFEAGAIQTSSLSVKDDIIASSLDLALGLNVAAQSFFGGAVGVSDSVRISPLAQTLTSAADSEFTSFSVTTPTITLSGGTNVTSQMDSILFGAPTITNTAAVTVTDATTLTISGAPVRAGLLALTNTYGLKINTSAVSTATNAYGLHVSAPTGATNNFAALFSGSTQINGGLCVRNATACPAFSGGRLYVDTAGTVAGDDPADVFDIAEMYASDSVSPGDVIAGSGIIEERTTEFGKIKLPSVSKAKTGYQKDILGIVSTRPAIGISGHFVITGPEAQKENADTAYVALAGRVPVKVTTENGIIQAGDYLTSSKLFPGYAMKATRSGQVIGQALETYSSNESGKVLTFLKPGYQVVNNTFVLEPSDGQITSQVFKIETSNQDTALLLNQKGVGDLLTFQANSTDRLVIRNDGTFNLIASQENLTLPVFSLRNIAKTLFVVYASGNLEIGGTIKVFKDTAGTAIVKMGDTQARVGFGSSYSSIPKISVTLVSDTDARFAVIQKNEQGFVIKLFSPAVSDTYFDWIALEQPEDTFSASSLNAQSVTQSNSNQSSPPSSSMPTNEPETNDASIQTSSDPLSIPDSAQNPEESTQVSPQADTQNSEAYPLVENPEESTPVSP